MLSTAETTLPDSVPTKADGFVSRSIADETVIVPVRAGVGNLDAVFTLNRVGATIWRLIDGRTSVSRLAAALSREYEVTEATARGDVVEFVALLTTKGLLTAAPAEGGMQP